MTEKLIQMPIWVFIEEFDFKFHTIKVKFSEESPIVDLRLNAVAESQLFKMIDVGHTPKKIQCFIDGNDLLSIVEGSEELGREKELEELEPEEALSNIKKGLYPKARVKRYLEQQKIKLELEEAFNKEVGEEKTQVPSILRFYKDSSRNKEIIENPNTKRLDIGTFEFEEYLHLYLFNDSEEGTISDLTFEFSDKDIHVVECPSEIKSKELKPLVLNFTPSQPRAFKSNMKFNYAVVFEPKEE